MDMYTGTDRFFSAWTIDSHFTCHTAYSARVTRNNIDIDIDFDGHLILIR
jgi:hypothetical protein